MTSYLPTYLPTSSFSLAARLMTDEDVGGGGDDDDVGGWAVGREDVGREGAALELPIIFSSGDL